MKMLISFLIVALFSVFAFGNVTSDQEYLLNHMNSVAQKTSLGSLLQKTKNLLVAKYSFAVQGGGSTTTVSLLTDLSNTKSFAQLPSKAIVTSVWLDILTTVTGLANATIALDAVIPGDLLAATGKASFNVGRMAGIPNGGTVSTFLKLPNFVVPLNGATTGGASTVKALIAVNALTAGKFNVYIEYVLGD